MGICIHMEDIQSHRDIYLSIDLSIYLEYICIYIHINKNESKGHKTKLTEEVPAGVMADTETTFKKVRMNLVQPDLVSRLDQISGDSDAKQFIASNCMVHMHDGILFTLSTFKGKTMGVWIMSRVFISFTSGAGAN